MQTHVIQGFPKGEERYFEQKSCLDRLRCHCAEHRTVSGGFAPESREEPEDYGGFRSGITYAMNTVIEQKWYGESADTVYTGMETKIREIESVLSLHLSQSEIAAINENAGVQPVEVSQRTFDLLQRAKELSEQSDGAFDITIAPVVELWGITSDHPHVPTDEELAQAMALMGLEDLVLDEEACTAYLTRPAWQSTWAASPRAGVPISSGNMPGSWERSGGMYRWAAT